ncbi:hypothetical protein [Microbacterium sp. 179-I 3D4 NHS]|uniref:hypothetical protein n=1 Tax=Microbacterium sp. 179-I 3D4 NHS TaxID=3142381 RepID=UPI0039A0DCCC
MAKVRPVDQVPAWKAEYDSGRRRRAVWTAVVIVLVVLAVMYAGRVFWLNVMAVEGDVPPASVVPLPSNAEILSESESCGSGGCSATLRIRPPEGLSPARLAEQMGVTPQLDVPGNFFDPRTVSVRGTPTGDLLTVSISYVSSEWFR